MKVQFFRAGAERRPRNMALPVVEERGGGDTARFWKGNASTMAAGSPSSPPSLLSRWPRWVPIAGWSVLGLLGATLLVFIATVTFGAVHGTEFCPQTFERRSYSYYEIPLVGWQITGERHEDLTGATEKTIISDKLLPTPASPKRDWHVLLGSRGTRLRRPGDAGILVEYLDAPAGKNSDLKRWDEWTQNAKTKDLAKVLWPAVQQLALREQYVLVPELFELAKQHDDPKALRAAVDRKLGQRLLFVAQKQAELGRSDAARTLLKEALAYDPQNTAAQNALDAMKENAPRAEAETAAPGNN